MPGGRRQGIPRKRRAVPQCTAYPSARALLAIHNPLGLLQLRPEPSFCFHTRFCEPHTISVPRTSFAKFEGGTTTTH